jgi:hypothetical protein
MEVHCSACDEIAYVDASDLQPSGADISSEALGGLVNDGEHIPSNLTTGSGFPYKFEEVVECIQEKLSMWEVDVVNDEHGVETLVLTCPKHLAAKHLDEIVEQYDTEVKVPDLAEFLLSIESHLRTIAQVNQDSFYSLQLANTARMLYNTRRLS